MGDTRRLVHRRTSTTLEFENGKKFEIKPLPWQRRNDLGQALVIDNVEQVNKQLRMFVDPELNVPQIEAQLNEPLSDYPKFIVMGLTVYEDGKEVSKPKPTDFDDFTFGELVELLVEILEINELSKLRRLIDPNSQTPTETTGENSSGTTTEALATMIGEKMLSSPDSSSEESVEVTSST